MISFSTICFAFFLIYLSNNNNNKTASWLFYLADAQRLIKRYSQTLAKKSTPNRDHYIEVPF